MNVQLQQRPVPEHKISFGDFGNDYPQAAMATKLRAGPHKVFRLRPPARSHDEPVRNLDPGYFDLLASEAKTSHFSPRPAGAACTAVTTRWMTRTRALPRVRISRSSTPIWRIVRA